MGEVATIHGGRLSGEPSPSVVGELEQLLAEAKRGEILGFAYVVVVRDAPVNAFRSGWDGEAGTRFPLAAGIMRLQHLYAEAMMEP